MRLESLGLDHLFLKAYTLDLRVRDINMSRCVDKVSFSLNILLGGLVAGVFVCILELGRMAP